MKKNLLVALLLLSFISCKKENSNPANQTDPETPSVVSDAKLVSQMTTASGDFTSTTKYNYNDKNQVTDAHITTSQGFYDDYELTYNADGTVKKEIRSSTYISSVRNFVYKNGFIDTIYYVEPANTRNNYYVKVKNNGTDVTEGTFYSMNGQAGSTATQEYANQNLVKSSSGFDDNLQVTTYEYGSKKHPFLYGGDKNLLFAANIPFNNKNDLLKEINTYRGDVTTTVSENTYDKDGYPTNVVKTTTYDFKNSTPIPSIIVTTVNYTYINRK